MDLALKNCIVEMTWIPTSLSTLYSPADVVLALWSSNCERYSFIIKCSNIVDWKILTATFQSGNSEWSTASSYALSVFESLASTRDQSILIRKGRWLRKILISMLVKEQREGQYWRGSSSESLFVGLVVVLGAERIKIHSRTYLLQQSIVAVLLQQRVSWCMIVNFLSKFQL